MTTPDPQAVGWRIVPVEPTLEMNHAGASVRIQGNHNITSLFNAEAAEVYAAMISASPVPEGVREKIAAVIAPRAFGSALNFDSFALLREDALAKADQILSLLSEGR